MDSLSLSLSLHPSLPSNAPSRSSQLHPVSAQTCCRLLLAGQPTLTYPCEGIYGRMSLMSSSLLPRQRPVCPVRLTWIVLVMGGKLPYSCCFVRYCNQDLFNITRSILVQFPSFSLGVLSVSMWCIHRVVLTQPLLGRNHILFYRID